MRIPDENVNVNLGAGRASMCFTDQAVMDFGSIPNALANGPSVPATAFAQLGHEHNGVFFP